MIVDFRSDTVTKPTEEMRKAMYTAKAPGSKKDLAASFF
ncbi:beta-eliminating lyase-related protein [Peribacillus saganii]|nr:beta-eliminating lyase-related protein [Peribacillus saganii]